MDSKYEALFTPWKIGNVEIKNRIVMTSMGGTSIFGWMEPNHFDEEAAKFLMERAKNNVGLILPGIAPILNPMLGQWLYSNKGMYRKLKAYMVEFHKTGAKLFVQLTAGFGRSFAINSTMEKIENNKVLNFLAKPVLNVDRICASASPSPNRWSDKVPSRALTVKEIEKMVQAFAKTAKLLKEAGVDGVEIHAVHEGYLLDQFTLKYVNKRTDQYGGTFENRYRFPVEIVKAIKEACGKDYPVSLRYSVVSKTKGMRQGALPGETYTEVGGIWPRVRKRPSIFRMPATICSTAITAPMMPGIGRIRRSICRRTATSRMSNTSRSSSPSRSSVQAVWIPSPPMTPSRKASSMAWALPVSS
jgi:2-enoate reductase